MFQEAAFQDFSAHRMDLHYNHLVDYQEMGFLKNGVFLLSVNLSFRNQKPLPGPGDGFLVGAGFFCPHNGFPSHSSGLLIEDGSSEKNAFVVRRPSLQHISANFFGPLAKMLT